MKTICITSYKGGVGKTLISFNFAGYLYSKGYKVLIIDLDGQMNMTRNMLPMGKKTQPPHAYTTGDIYNREVTDKEAHPDILIYKNSLEKYEGFDMIPAHTQLKRWEDLYQMTYPQTMNVALAIWIETYRKYLEKRYDFIIVDSSPNLSVGTRTALTAADDILLISDVSGNSLNATVDLYNKWNSDCLRTIPPMTNNISLTFANNVDIRTGMAKEFIENISAIKEEYPDKYCDNYIKSSAKIKESELYGPVCLNESSELKNNPGVESMIKTFAELCERRGYNER